CYNRTLREVQVDGSRGGYVGVADSRDSVQVPIRIAGRARRPGASARLSARVEFPGCRLVLAFAKRTRGRDPSVTRSGTPSQRGPAPERGLARQTRQHDRAWSVESTISQRM